MEPEDIESREFPTTLRGYDRQEVENFAREIAEHVRQLRSELEAARAALQKAEVAPPSPPSPAPAPRTPPAEAQRLDVYQQLGEETARILISAEQAGDHIKELAKREAAEVLADARREAGRVARRAREGKQQAEGDLRQLLQTRSVLAGQLEEVRRRLGEAVARLQVPLDQLSSTAPRQEGPPDVLPSLGEAQSLSVLNSSRRDAGAQSGPSSPEATPHSSPGEIVGPSGPASSEAKPGKPASSDAPAVSPEEDLGPAKPRSEPPSKIASQPSSSLPSESPEGTGAEEVSTAHTSAKDSTVLSGGEKVKDGLAASPANGTSKKSPAPRDAVGPHAPRDVVEILLDEIRADSRQLPSSERPKSLVEDPRGGLLSEKLSDKRLSKEPDPADRPGTRGKAPPPGPASEPGPATKPGAPGGSGPPAEAAPARRLGEASPSKPSAEVPAEAKRPAEKGSSRFPAGAPAGADDPAQPAASALPSTLQESGGASRNTLQAVVSGSPGQSPSVKPAESGRSSRKAGLHAVPSQSKAPAAKGGAEPGLSRIAEAPPAPDTAAEESDFFAKRTQVLGETSYEVARKLKRLFGEDHNDLLHRLRSRRGRGTLEENVVPEQEQLDRFNRTLEGLLQRAFTEGRKVAGAPAEGGHAASVSDLVARQVVLPLRADLCRVVETGLAAGDTATAISERASDVFRIWKGVRTDLLAEGLLFAAFHQGLLDAWKSMPRAVKSWVLSPEEQECPKGICKTNASEGPVPVGSSFSSGHDTPPAHGGCTCGLQPS